MTTGTMTETPVTTGTPVAKLPSQGAVVLTEKAADEIRRVVGEMQQAGRLPADSFVRVGVTGGGCSGFSYAFGFDNKFDAAVDEMSEQHGIKVVVNKMHALHLDGTKVDFHQSLEKRGFTFDNPNAVKTCGCGSSFSG